MPNDVKPKKEPEQKIPPNQFTFIKITRVICIFNIFIQKIFRRTWSKNIIKYLIHRGVIIITLANELLIQGPYVGYPKIVALDSIIDTDHFLRQTTQLYFYKNIPRQAYDGTK